MPTLTWIGKDKVVNHHHDVPYRVLEHKYGFRAEDDSDRTPTDSGNKIIHGDNLEALKSLLPEYEGRVKCIYIDPPYNTGNEKWVYNDNVNDPKIKKWLGEVVGKQGEDLSRHDKWLCMMYPRLKLLHKLLAEDGAIFISIDDNEQANLRLLCDEIFGANNFIANIMWQKRTSPDARLNLGAAHDFILCYAQNYNTLKPLLHKLPHSEERRKAYKNPDNDPRGAWASVDLTGQTGHATENQYYGIPSPDGTLIFPPKGRCWALAENTFLNLIQDNRIWFGSDGHSRPRQKKFLSEMEGAMAWTWWTNVEVGHNQEATKELNQILEKTGEFETPKPERLIKRILQIATNKDSIILDSFAGSGTTAHAVLNLNQKNGGNRKFILVEMNDYAEYITAERVRRVMCGYGEGKNAVAGTGGAFDYYELGEPMFDKEGNLNEDIAEERIWEYIYYTETRQHLKRKRSAKNKYLLDKYNGTAYYFYYERSKLTTLGMDTLDIVTEKAEQYVVYADICTLPEDFMLVHNIIFKKIPRDIKRF
ncbi:MAG: site-specific DNA-methyltransferase [Bacteroides sp.]|nr:site-specific DNA-methyltransferase [Bacteroides sp.]